MNLGVQQVQDDSINGRHSVISSGVTISARTLHIMTILNRFPKPNFKGSMFFFF